MNDKSPLDMFTKERDEIMNLLRQENPNFDEQSFLAGYHTGIALVSEFFTKQLTVAKTPHTHVWEKTGGERYSFPSQYEVKCTCGETKWITRNETIPVKQL